MARSVTWNTRTSRILKLIAFCWIVLGSAMTVAPAQCICNGDCQDCTACPRRYKVDPGATCEACYRRSANKNQVLCILNAVKAVPLAVRTHGDSGGDLPPTVPGAVPEPNVDIDIGDLVIGDLPGTQPTGSGGRGGFAWGAPELPGTIPPGAVPDNLSR